MKLFCKGEYHNGPASLHFAGPGVIEVDQLKAEFLLKDAPENFTTELPGNEGAGQEEKSLDSPTADKAVKAPGRKK